MDSTRTRTGLDANLLKLIAILAMTADHIAWLLFPGYPKEALPLILHIIGRITCPIMCFFIAEGFHYTRNVRKYTLRLLVFAVVSHFAYMFAAESFVDWRSFVPFLTGSALNQTSVMWSLLGGLVLLRVNARTDLSATKKFLAVIAVCLVTFPADWSCIAAMCVLVIGSNRGQPKKQIIWCFFFVSLYVLVYCLALDVTYGLVQYATILAIPLLCLYNGKRGKNPTINRYMKWLFYIYYPLHLTIIGIVKLFLR